MDRDLSKEAAESGDAGRTATPTRATGAPSVNVGVGTVRGVVEEAGEKEPVAVEEAPSVDCTGQIFLPVLFPIVTMLRLALAAEEGDIGRVIADVEQAGLAHVVPFAVSVDAGSVAATAGRPGVSCNPSDAGLLDAGGGMSTVVAERVAVVSVAVTEGFSASSVHPAVVAVTTSIAVLGVDVGIKAILLPPSWY